MLSLSVYTRWNNNHRHPLIDADVCVRVCMCISCSADKNGEVSSMQKTSLTGGRSPSCLLCGWSTGARRDQAGPQRRQQRWRRAVGSLALVKFQQDRAKNADAARDYDVAFIHKGLLMHGVLYTFIHDSMVDATSILVVYLELRRHRSTAI